MELDSIYIVSFQIKSISLMTPLSALIKQVFNPHGSFLSEKCDKMNEKYLSEVFSNLPLIFFGKLNWRNLTLQW